MNCLLYKKAAYLLNDEKICEEYGGWWIPCFLMMSMRIFFVIPQFQKPSKIIGTWKLWTENHDTALNEFIP